MREEVNPRDVTHQTTHSMYVFLKIIYYLLILYHNYTCVALASAVEQAVSGPEAVVRAAKLRRLRPTEDDQELREKQVLRWKF